MIWIDHVATVAVVCAVMSIFFRDKRTKITLTVTSVVFALLYVGMVAFDDCEFRVDGECVVYDTDR